MLRVHVMPDRKKPSPPSSASETESREEEAQSEEEEKEKDDDEDEAEVPPDPLEQQGGRGAVPAPPTVELAIRDALKKGDVKFALTLAASHYRAPLIRFCMAFVHDETTAEDVAQTALTVAAERATEFSGQSTFRTWIFGIARHK